MISKFFHSLAWVVYFFDFTPYTFPYSLYFFVQAIPVLMIQIAFINILVSWFYLGYSLKMKSLSEERIKRSGQISTCILIASSVCVVLFMVISILLINSTLSDGEVTINFYSIFNALVFYIICFIYIGGGIWMLKLMKNILMPAWYESCWDYLMKIIVSGSVVSFIWATFNLIFLVFDK